MLNVHPRYGINPLFVPKYSYIVEYVYTNIELFITCALKFKRKKIWIYCLKLMKCLATLFKIDEMPGYFV